MGSRSVKAVCVSACIAALALGLGLLGSGCASSVARSFATQHFVSRPDLRPTPVRVLTRAHGGPRVPVRLTEKGLTRPAR